MNRILNGFLLAGGLVVLSTGCGLLAPATYDTAAYQAIHQAALDGDTNKITALLQTSPAIVNVADYDKNTPLHLAAMSGRTDAARLLIQRGAKVNALNSAHMTPLHLAAKEGFIEVAKSLVEARAEVNIKDSRGWAPLDWAERAHHTDVADLLRAHGALQ